MSHKACKQLCLAYTSTIEIKKFTAFKRQLVKGIKSKQNNF